MKEKEKEGKGEKNLHSGNLVLKGLAVAFNFHVSLAIVHGGPSWAQKAEKCHQLGGRPFGGSHRWEDTSPAAPQRPCYSEGEGQRRE